MLPTDVQQGCGPQIDSRRRSVAAIQVRDVELEIPGLCDIQASRQEHLFREEGRSTSLEAVEFHELFPKPFVVAFPECTDLSSLVICRSVIGVQNRVPR